MLQLTFNGLCKISLIVFWGGFKVGKQSWGNSGRKYEWSIFGETSGRALSKVRRKLRKVRRYRLSSFIFVI
ncbi:unnamed protein product [Meloidogyne enterolobii]|uniref:Uncharacterized protein n=1 Tax=Meloidogyne enterolobii TaxID=390850 RepID=A0ACB1A750_MELEN